MLRHDDFSCVIKYPAISRNASWTGPMEFRGAGLPSIPQVVTQQDRLGRGCAKLYKTLELRRLKGSALQKHSTLDNTTQTRYGPQTNIVSPPNITTDLGRNVRYERFKLYREGHSQLEWICHDRHWRYLLYHRQMLLQFGRLTLVRL